MSPVVLDGYINQHTHADTHTLAHAHTEAHTHTDTHRVKVTTEDLCSPEQTPSTRAEVNRGVLR